MRYTIRTVNSQAKRHVRSKVFAADLVGVGTTHSDPVSMTLTLNDPRTPTGEGYRMEVYFNNEDAAPLMAALVGRLYAMLPTELQAEADRVIARESAKS